MTMKLKNFRTCIFFPFTKGIFIIRKKMELKKRKTKKVVFMVEYEEKNIQDDKKQFSFKLANLDIYLDRYYYYLTENCGYFDNF